MSEILSPDQKKSIAREYCRREALSRLSQWPLRGSKFASAFEYLSSRKGYVKAVVDAAELPLTQVLLNDPQIDRVDPAVVDGILARIVHERELGVLTVDTLGLRLFKPWGEA